VNCGRQSSQAPPRCQPIETISIPVNSVAQASGLPYRSREPRAGKSGLGCSPFWSAEARLRFPPTRLDASSPSHLTHSLPHG